MKMFRFLLNLVILITLNFNLNAQSLPEGYPKTNRQKIVLTDGWKFHLDKGENGFKETPPAVSDWEEVTIPHTLKLTSLDKDGCKDDDFQLTFHRWIGWYKRNLKVNVPKGQKVFLEFEGAHQVTKLWVNGKYVGIFEVGGYSPFHFDISDFVQYNGKDNEIMVSVDNRQNSNIPPEGDRYDYIKWGGLYRDVYLVVTDALHISFNWENYNSGVFITTPTVTATDATINIKTNVRNESEVAKECQIINRVIDANGIVVLKFEAKQTIKAKSEFTFSQTGGIEENVRLWSPNDPYLYRVNTLIMDGKQPVDCIENPLGIRKIELIDGKGFVLNGKNVELIGPNRHQGMLFIGDAVPNSLNWEDAWQFKQAGFNSVRLAHYPHDNSFIEACDHYGIIVYEEPPTWIGMGNEKWFDNLEEATRRMVRNHRNHPSLVFWAAGLNHRGPVERLHYAIKEEDPTRLTASNGAPWTGPRNSGVTDVYSPMDYDNMPLMPNEFTYLCEHGTSANASSNQYETSKSRENANMIGVALWTAHDYQSFKAKGFLSPSRPWSAYRVPNPVFYWYQSELLEKPMVYIADKRASNENQIVIFSNCQRVDLYNDGKLVASQFPDKTPGLLFVDHPSFTFNYEWKEGELSAKGYMNNLEACIATKKKQGKPTQIKLEIESHGLPFVANGSDIKLAHAYILDENGTVVTDAEMKVRFTVEGSGEIIGDEEMGANPNKPYWGVATAFVRTGKDAGEIKVTATADGLKLGLAKISTVPFIADQILAKAKPIFELKRERIDLSSNQKTIQSAKEGLFEIGKSSSGGSSQFLQFGWTAWVGEGKTSDIFNSKSFPGCQMKILAAGDSLDWYTNWGQVGNLPYLAVDGVRTNSSGEIQLEFTGLPKGKYSLKSYHHQAQEIKKAPNSLQIIVSDGKSKNRIAEKGLRLSSTSLFNREPASANYFFYSDGTNPVVVQFRSLDKTIGVVINGFDLQEVID